MTPEASEGTSTTTLLLSLAIVFFPLMTAGAGALFRSRQNKGDIVGGAISWPKALWLAYTVLTWFLLPIIYILLGLCVGELAKPWPPTLWVAFIGHLLSWWVRGPLELFMIYKWFNWSPRYGITHDLVHAGFLAAVFGAAFLNGEIEFWYSSMPTALAALLMFVTFFMTMAEALFAFLFLFERTTGEDLLYFASDDPRWQMINRITATVVTIAYLHLLFQSLLLVKWILTKSHVVHIFTTSPVFNS